MDKIPAAICLIAVRFGGEDDASMTKRRIEEATMMLEEVEAHIAHLFFGLTKNKKQMYDVWCVRVCVSMLDLCSTNERGVVARKNFER
mmetsp:Transcript_23733/g.44335  ORF Transcript_23733/g.44335 Transcript_23733/m.44335 type:complete len:88 (+) Transcript_23733:293-556(+)